MPQREGYPNLTPVMLGVLRCLKAAKDCDTPFIPLDNANPRTLKALQRLDLILMSKAHSNGTIEYTLTGRGIKTLAAFENSKKRTDGICRRCGINPRLNYPSGRLKPYCDDCLREHWNSQYRMKGYQCKPDTPCSKCGKRNRLILPNGQAVAYCAKCRTANRKKERRRKMKRRLALIAAGTSPICIRCKSKPVYQAGKTVYDYCHVCYRQQQAEAAEKRKAKNFAKKISEGATKK
jgi:hypothetical protein